MAFTTKLLRQIDDLKAQLAAMTERAEKAEADLKRIVNAVMDVEENEAIQYDEDFTLEDVIAIAADGNNALSKLGEIETLEGKIAELRAGLLPFAKFANATVRIGDSLEKSLLGYVSSADLHRATELLK